MTSLFLYCVASHCCLICHLLYTIHIFIRSFRLHTIYVCVYMCIRLMRTSFALDYSMCIVHFSSSLSVTLLFSPIQSLLPHEKPSNWLCSTLPRCLLYLPSSSCLRSSARS